MCRDRRFDSFAITPLTPACLIPSNRHSVDQDGADLLGAAALDVGADVDDALEHRGETGETGRYPLPSPRE